MRQSSGILLWNCITHMDIGRFSSMADALSAIDDGSDVIRQAPVANVYPIRGGMVRCA